jgi:predicted HicB family RNase H-like nuclease
VLALRHGPVPREATPASDGDRVQVLLRLPRDLHRALKHAAVDRDTSVNEMLSQALREWWKDQPERVRY